jgi:hypothetical protein
MKLMARQASSSAQRLEQSAAFGVGVPNSFSSRPSRLVPSSSGIFEAFAELVAEDCVRLSWQAD